MSDETIDYRKLAEALAEALEQRNLWIEGEEYRELVILRMRLSARVDSLAEELKAATARIAELEAKNERFTAHSDIERQDDKSPNDTQTQTIVYGKEGGEVSEIVCKNCGAKNLIPNWE